MRKWTIYSSDGLSDLDDMIFIEIHYIHKKEVEFNLEVPLV